MDYVMFGIGEAATYQSVRLLLGVRSSDDYSHGHFFWTTDLDFLKLGISGSALAHLPDVSGPGPSFGKLDWTYYQQNPLRQICISY